MPISPIWQRPLVYMLTVFHFLKEKGHTDMDAVTTMWGWEGHMHSKQRQLCSETCREAGKERDCAREQIRAKHLRGERADRA